MKRLVSRLAAFATLLGAPALPRVATAADGGLSQAAPSPVVPNPAAPSPAAPSPAAPNPAQLVPGPPALSAPSPPAAPPKPAPELESLKPFLGRWRCEGRAFATPISSGEHPISAVAEGRLDADGFWQSYRYEEKKTKLHPGLKLQGWWGYDQGAKRFVRAAVGNQGEWETATTAGWEGERLIWTGEVSGNLGGVPGRVAFRHTFIKKGERLWTQALELLAPDGRWIQTQEVTCKR